MEYFREIKERYSGPLGWNRFKIKKGWANVCDSRRSSQETESLCRQSFINGGRLRKNESASPQIGGFSLTVPSDAGAKASFIIVEIILREGTQRGCSLPKAPSSLGNFSFRILRRGHGPIIAESKEREQGHQLLRGE